MLNLGPVSAPYEPKRGERMVPPQPNKNLFNDIYTVAHPSGTLPGDVLYQTGVAGTVSAIVPVEVGQTYTVTAIGQRNRFVLATFDSLTVGSKANDVKNDLSNSTASPLVQSITVTKGNYLVVYVSNQNEKPLIQVEKGSGTPYEPYRVRTTRRRTDPIRKAPKLPKKNYIKGEKEQDNALFNQGTGTTHLNGSNVWENGKLRVESGSSAVHGRGQVLDVIPGATYTFSCKAENINARVIIGATDKGAEYVPIHMASSTPSVSFVATSDKVWLRFLINGPSSSVNPAYFWDIQLEPGSAMSPFEYHKLISRPAPKGLELDGIDDYITLPTVMDFSGKDFELEATYIWNGENAAGSAQQTILGIGDSRFGIQNVSAKQLGYYTASAGWSSVFQLVQGEKQTLKVVVKPDLISIYIDGVFVTSKSYTGAIPSSSVYIGALGGGSYRFKGVLYSVIIRDKGMTVLDFDFTSPSKNIGSAFKSNVGPDGTLLGSPTQLNRQARR
jgi:hypothetical protein